MAIALLVFLFQIDTIVYLFIRNSRLLTDNRYRGVYLYLSGNEINLFYTDSGPQTWNLLK